MAWSGLLVCCWNSAMIQCFRWRKSDIHLRRSIGPILQHFTFQNPSVSRVIDPYAAVLLISIEYHRSVSEVIGAIRQTQTTVLPQSGINIQVCSDFLQPHSSKLLSVILVQRRNWQWACKTYTCAALHVQLGS